MAVLSDSDRLAVAADFMRTEESTIACLKADLKAAANALDTFLNNNASTINQAIPAAARSALTTAQKARLLVWVIRQRYIAGA